MLLLCKRTANARTLPNFFFSKNPIQYATDSSKISSDFRNDLDHRFEQFKHWFELQNLNATTLEQQHYYFEGSEIAYIGDMQHSKADGFGHYVNLKQGKSVRGDWKHGQICGSVIFDSFDSSSSTNTVSLHFEGGQQMDQWEGYGMLKLQNGQKIWEGIFSQGQLIPSQIVFCKTDTLQYKGYFETLSSEKNEQHSLSKFDYQFHGIGVLENHQTQTVTVGDFVHNQSDGVMYQSGTKGIIDELPFNYLGQVSQNLFQGFGIYSSHRHRFECFWKQGKIDQYGHFQYKDTQREYFGEIQNESWNGLGICYDKMDGGIYYGQWLQGQLIGESVGVYTNSKQKLEYAGDFYPDSSTIELGVLIHQRNGLQYEYRGELLGAIPSGYGIELDSKGSVLRSGMWNRGNLEKIDLESRNLATEKAVEALQHATLARQKQRNALELVSKHKNTFLQQGQTMQLKIEEDLRRLNAVEAEFDRKRKSLLLESRRIQQRRALPKNHSSNLVPSSNTNSAVSVPPIQFLFAMGDFFNLFQSDDYYAFGMHTEYTPYIVHYYEHPNPNVIPFFAREVFIKHNQEQLRNLIIICAEVLKQELLNEKLFSKLLASTDAQFMAKVLYYLQCIKADISKITFFDQRLVQDLLPEQKKELEQLTSQVKESVTEDGLLTKEEIDRQWAYYYITGDMVPIAKLVNQLKLYYEAKKNSIDSATAASQLNISTSSSSSVTSLHGRIHGYDALHTLLMYSKSHPKLVHELELIRSTAKDYPTIFYLDAILMSIKIYSFVLQKKIPASSFYSNFE